MTTSSSRDLEPSLARVLERWTWLASLVLAVILVGIARPVHTGRSTD